MQFFFRLPTLSEEVIAPCFWHICVLYYQSSGDRSYHMSFVLVCQLGALYGNYTRLSQSSKHYIGQEQQRRFGLRDVVAELG